MKCSAVGRKNAWLLPKPTRQFRDTPKAYFGNEIHCMPGNNIGNNYKTAKLPRVKTKKATPKALSSPNFVPNGIFVLT